MSSNVALPVSDRSRQFALRAAVAEHCQMRCVYCPTSTFENFAPEQFRNRGLAHSDYSLILANLLKAVPFEKVSFTGGEPLLNPQLESILSLTRPLVSRTELNTNGLLLTRDRYAAISSYIDQVKVSIDTVDPTEFQKITKLPSRNALDRVLSSIGMLKGFGVEIVLNCVLMRRTFDHICDLIDFAAEHCVRLHILDICFTEERRQFWEKEYCPTEALIPLLAERYGVALEVPRFGCGYFEFHPAERTVVRVRTSFSGTMRSQRCVACSHYCQTGLFGLMLSTDGWVTTCQASSYEADGVLLEPDMSPFSIREALSSLLYDITSAQYVPDSFSEMIQRRNLHPEHVSEVQQLARQAV